MRVRISFLHDDGDEWSTTAEVLVDTDVHDTACSRILGLMIAASQKAAESMDGAIGPWEEF